MIKVEADILRRMEDARTHGNTNLFHILELALARVKDLQMMFAAGIPEEEML